MRMHGRNAALILLLALLVPASHAQTITEIVDSAGDGIGNTLDGPRRVAVDGSGNVYVTGRHSENVFKITPGGIITEIIDATGDGAGNPFQDADGGLAVDMSGNVYVAGSGSSNVFKITPGGVITEIIDATGDGAGNSLAYPRGLAVDVSGNVYVVGANSYNAFKITPGGVITEIIDSTGDGAGNPLQDPWEIAVDGAGNSYVTGGISRNAFKITPGGVITEIIDSTGDGAGNTLNNCLSVAADGSGNVYVGSSTNAFKITPGGVISEIIDATGDGAGNTLSSVRGIAVDGSGNVYVTGGETDNAFKITLSGVITEIIDATGGGAGNPLDLAFDIAVDGSGNVYVPGRNSDNVFKIPAELGQPLSLYWPHSGGSRTIEHVATDGSGFGVLLGGLAVNMRGIAIDAVAGKIYWSSATTISRANLDGSNQEIILSGLVQANGVALDVAAMKIYWVDGGLNTLNRANLDGSASEVLSPAGVTANGLAVDTVNGRVYWSDQNQIVIASVDLNGNDFQQFLVSNAGGALSAAEDIAVDPVNGKLYWAAPGIGLIQRANLDGTNQEDLISAGTALGIDIDPLGGKVYWTNRIDGTVERANLDGTGVEVLVSGLEPVGNASFGPEFVALGPVPVQLTIPTAIPAPSGALVDVPVELTTNTNALASLAFSIDYDSTCLSFDPTDTDADGIPDALDIPLPVTFSAVVFHDLGDTDGELDIVLFADDPTTTTFADGVLATFTFSAICSSGPTDSILTPVAFSSDPTPSFGDPDAQAVVGIPADGSVEIFSGLRGDCNGDGIVSAPDITACHLESFDGDGTFWADTLDVVPFLGSSVGCDANADTAVDAGDLSCKARLIFGLACGGAMHLVSSKGPSLSLSTELSSEGGGVVAAITFEPRGDAVNSLMFSIDYDESRLTFDDVPGAVRFLGTPVSLESLTFDAGDTAGELDVVIADLTTTSVLSEGLLVEVDLRLLEAGTATIEDGVTFSVEPPASFGDIEGRSVPGTTEIDTGAQELFADGFESGDTSDWSREH